MVAAITGLAALLHTSALAFEILEYTGAAFHGVEHGKGQGALTVEDQDAPPSTVKVIISGILINILNPKLTIFFFAFLPEFVNVDGQGAFVPMLELSAVFMLVTFVVFVGCGVFAASGRDDVISRPPVLTWMRRVFAGSFAALEARLALAAR